MRKKEGPRAPSALIFCRSYQSPVFTTEPPTQPNRTHQPPAEPRNAAVSRPPPPKATSQYPNRLCQRSSSTLEWRGKLVFCSGRVCSASTETHNSPRTTPYFFPSSFPVLPTKHQSEGCASAVKRILSKCDGVEDVQTNVEAKTVVVVTADDSVSPQVMLEKLQKVRVRVGSEWSARSDSQIG